MQWDGWGHRQAGGSGGVPQIRTRYGVGRLDVKVTVWIVGVLATLLFVVAVPLLIFSANGVAVVFDPDFYSRGQVQQQVEQAYGLSQSVLVPVNRGIVRYFASSRETLSASLAAEGADPGFFSQRETIHMADVHRLVRLVVLIERASLMYAIMFVVASLLLLRTGAVGRIGACLVAGGVLAVAVVLLVGVFTMIDFGDFWSRQHLLWVSNDSWILDPRTDHLIQMTGFGFFRDATVYLVLRSLLTTVGVVLAGGFLLWLGRRLL